jgi:radical SAM-linked protein
VAYRKADRLRFLSHLEIARANERAVRRAGFPFVVTQGFSPRMRIAFGPALPVGTAGERELYEVWLHAFVRPEEAFARLAAVSAPELAPVQVAYAADHAPSLAGEAVAAAYRVETPGVTLDSLLSGVAALRTAGVLEVEHKGKRRTFDLAETLVAPPLVRPGGFDVTVRISESGSLRPDALASAVLEYSGATGAEALVTRTGLLVDRAGVLADPLS